MAISEGSARMMTNSYSSTKETTGQISSDCVPEGALHSGTFFT